MRIVRDIEDFPAGLSVPVVTIGNFDGVHRGHQAVVRRLCAEARERGGTAVVITFRPHPSKILHPERAPALICTYAEKLHRLEELGVDVVLEVPFDRDFSDVAAEDFIADVLVGRIGAQFVLVGPDSRFGKGRRGDAVLLRAHGGFEVEAMDPVLCADLTISSSAIRELVTDVGDVRAATELLGRAPRLYGIVIRGDQRGRTLGFPTANLDLHSELVPRTGVYAARAQVAEGRSIGAVVNVGVRPTFGGLSLAVEAHLLDFEGDVYGEVLTLDLIDRIRDERRFAHVSELVAQIRHDVARGRELLG